MATTQSILDRVTYVTKDYDRVRWTLPELSQWLNDAQGLIASLHPRAASQYKVITLAAGARQDLRVIEPTTRWIRLFELTCNVTTVGGVTSPNGRTISQVSRPILDAAFPTWRSKPPTATSVSEFTMDEREVFTFDVNPPVAAGVKVLALVAITPPPCAVLNDTGTALANAAEVFGLADGYDIPAVDYVIFRAYNKDANNPGYATDAANHLQAFQLAMGVETKDASAA